MYFTSITITNLFSYYGKQSIRFPEPQANCNITLIMGRNGFGKTSFINSMKMLFAAESEEIRRTVQRKRLPTPKQFVMGITNEWWGILNRKAKLEDETNTCSIAASWHGDDGMEVHAIRKWTLDFKKDDYESILKITHPWEGELTGDKAEQFLESRLPRSYIPFFFFDGEEVQAIAESNDTQNIETMELLLNIKPVENMQHALIDLMRSWKRKASNAEQEKELNDKERKKAEKEDQIKVYKEKLENIEYELAENEYQQKQIDAQLRRLRGSSSKETEIKLKKDQEKLEKERRERMEQLATYWKRDAFLTMNIPLHQKLMKKLEPLLSSNVGEQQQLLNAVQQRLFAMFETIPFPTPRLQKGQVRFYKKRIETELAALNVTDMPVDSFDISYERSLKLYKQLSLYGKGNNLYQDMLAQINQVVDANANMQEIDKKLKITGGLTEKNQEEYERLMQEDEKVKDAWRNIERDKINYENQLHLLEKDITRIQREIDLLDSGLQKSKEKTRQVNFAKNLKEALEEVKRRLREQKCKELENGLNKYLPLLLTSNMLIKKIKVNENFEQTYKDKDGNDVGMSTISAGMKQLVATALLWSLKEASGRKLPVIIDTPMGRIDRSHQKNLLENYYPSVAEQLILLPTDSEIDKEKYQVLKPYLCQEYYLDNPDGQSSSIKKIKGGLYG